jgi:hypothetical protein
MANKKRTGAVGVALDDPDTVIDGFAGVVVQPCRSVAITSRLPLKQVHSQTMTEASLYRTHGGGEIPYVRSLDRCRYDEERRRG